MRLSLCVCVFAGMSASVCNEHVYYDCAGVFHVSGVIRYIPNEN